MKIFVSYSRDSETIARSVVADLESLGRVDYLVFFIFCRADRDLSDLAQLKGLRIAYVSDISGIGVDPDDGLLRQGQEGYQLTWMDAKVGDWVVTPRRGKGLVPFVTDVVTGDW